MKNLEPNNHRISNSLFESIQNVMAGKKEQVAEAENAGTAVDKAHFCATHVEHALLGQGVCISEQHAEPDENGDIAWYSVQFPSGIQRVNTSNLKITEGKSHTHGKKMAEEQEQIDELSINTLTRVKSAATSAASDASREGDEDKATKRYNLAGNASNKIEKANRAAGLKPSGQHQFGEGKETIEEGSSVIQGKGTTPGYKSGSYTRPASIPTQASKSNSGMQANKDIATPPKHQIVKHLAGTVLDPRVPKPKNEGNDGNLANNAKPYDKVTRGDVISGRLGKDEMGGKKKKVSEVADPDHILPKDAPAPVSKSTEDKEKKGAMSKAVAAHNTGKGGMDAGKESNVKDVKEARSTGTVFDKPKDNPLTKDIKSSFNKKQVSTGTVYTRKPQKDMDDKGKKIKESITQTVINYNDFVLEITDNPTYGDYLRALQTMVESRDESIQHEVVALATEAFNEKIDSIIVEAKARITFEPRFQALRESGVEVSDENYVVENGEPYVEYTVQEDGKSIQYVHMGKVQKV